MKTDTPEAGTRPGTSSATPTGTSSDERRAEIAPLLMAGLSLRAIAARTGIPLSAVHRVKRFLEKAGRAATTSPSQPPSSYVTQQVIDGVTHQVRHPTIVIYERAVTKAIDRELLSAEGRGDAMTVISALFAGMFSDTAIDRLCRYGYLDRAERGRGEAVIAVASALIERLR